MVRSFVISISSFAGSPVVPDSSRARLHKMMMIERKAPRTPEKSLGDADDVDEVVFLALNPDMCSPVKDDIGRIKRMCVRESPRAKKRLSLSQQLAQARELTSPVLMPFLPGKKRATPQDLSPTKRRKRESTALPQQSTSPSKKLLSPRKSQQKAGAPAKAAIILKSPGQSATSKLGVKETPPTALANMDGAVTRHRHSVYRAVLF